MQWKVSVFGQLSGFQGPLPISNHIYWCIVYFSDIVYVYTWMYQIYTHIFLMKSFSCTRMFLICKFDHHKKQKLSINLWNRPQIFNMALKAPPDLYNIVSLTPISSSFFPWDLDPPTSNLTNWGSPHLFLSLIRIALCLELKLLLPSPCLAHLCLVVIWFGWNGPIPKVQGYTNPILLTKMIGVDNQDLSQTEASTS